MIFFLFIFFSSFCELKAQGLELSPSAALLIQEENSPPPPLLQFSSWFIGVGALSEFNGEIQVDEFGQTNELERWPFLKAGAQWSLPQNFLLAPEFLMALPRENEDESLTRSLFMLRALVKTPMYWHLRLVAGTSLAINWMEGRGGTQELPNGEGTSSFFLPSQKRASLNNTLDLGIEWGPWWGFSLTAEAIFYSLLADEKRAATYLLGLTYFFEKNP